MSKNRKRESNEEEIKISPLTDGTNFLQPNYRTVGTCRLSKSGQALSIKLFPENRYLHIRKRDIELIFEDINHATVANIREYLPKEV